MKTVEYEVELNRVIYKKDDFQILSLIIIEKGVKTNTITAKGTCPIMEYNMRYKLIANEIQDPKYGLQYQILNIHSDYNLNDRNEQEKFLSFFLTTNQVTNLFTKYSDPIPLLENKDINALCKVKGISINKANKIIEAYFANKNNSKAYIKLSDFGLSKLAIDKLVETYDSPDLAIEKVSANPYILIEEVSGYGWNRADSIALNSGTPPTSKFRLSAFAKYYLNKRAEEDGNTWISLQELRNAYLDIIPEATDDMIREVLKALTTPLFGKEAELLYFPTTDRICLSKYYKLEQNIVKEIKRLQNSKNLPYNEELFSSIIKQLEETQGWTFTEEQIKATRIVLDNPVSIITGSAGAGKTSTLSLATSILTKEQSYSIAQTALSGRAASRMSEITSIAGYTIHRLLQIKPESGVPTFNASNPLKYNIVILDETSMVDGFIFLKLLRAIPTGSKLIMLGDSGQLEAIGLCNLLKDMLHSNTIPNIELKTIHRQAAKSGILTTAIKIRNGEQIIPSPLWEGEQTIGELQDLTLIGLEGNTYTQEVILDNYKKLLNQGISKDDIDVIVPMRKRGSISLNILNKKIQNIVANKNFNSICLNSKAPEEEQKFIYEQDRIIITENCYRGIFNEDEEEIPLFNGNIGKVISIDESSGRVKVKMAQQGIVTLPRGLLSSMDLGYAITCHAKQGSETPFAIIGIDSSCYTLMSKEWLYTAVTRAKKHCILIGQNTILHKAVQISSISRKQTWLYEMLKFTH